MTQGLVQIATRRAAALVGNVYPEDLATAKPLRRPAVAIGGVLVFVILIGLFIPRLLSCQWARFVDPFGDHPPYSSLTFLVQPGDAQVDYGSALDVTAETSGAKTDQVDLVLAPEGQAEQVVPMFLGGDGKWQATLVNVESPGNYFLRSGRARTERYSLGVITVPRLQKVTFKIALPAYTNRPPYEGPLPQTGVSGLPGTQVTVTATSNRPLSGGQLTLSMAGEGSAGVPETIPMIASGDNEAQGAFEIHGSGKFELKVIDTDKQISTDSFAGTITQTADEKPFVRIVEPYATSFATPDATINVRAIAEDDYGISKLEIYRGLNDSRFRAVEIPVPMPAPTQFPGTTTLRLADYALSPGDVVKLFARTEDNDPAGPKGAESSMVEVHVVAQKDMDQMTMERNAMDVLQSKYGQAARRLEAAQAEAANLQKELAARDPAKPLSPQDQAKLNKLAKDLAEAAKDIDKLQTHELPIDLDKALSAQLAALSAALKSASSDAGSAATTQPGSQPGMSVAGALDKLSQIQRKLGAQKQDFKDNATAPLEYLAQIYPLMQDQMRFLDIYNHQKDLAGRLASIQTANGQDDPQLKARMRDLRDEQHQLRDDLRQLLDDIDSHVGALPPDERLDQLRNTASDFSKAVRNSPADGQMQDAETALEEFAGTPASTNAKAAEDTLNSFISRCQSMGQQGGVCLKFQPKLSAGLGDSVSELLSMGMGGMGMGGGGGGYTAMQNSLMNVGLYGTIPLLSQESGSHGGQADHGVASADDGSPSGKASPDAGAASGTLSASGASDAPVPPQYKKQVGEYFQRVDDELAK
jgi:hypothetical protein